MTYHILNGDALAYSFPEAAIPGEVAVVREALIDGDLSGGDLHAFWQTRARHLNVPDAEYQTAVVNEFEKLLRAPDGSEFNLWFEYDLFCQANMWFVLSILADLPVNKKVFAVYTTQERRQFWNGFGRANSHDLQICMANRVPLSDADLQLGKALWQAYKAGDLAMLGRLAREQSIAYPHIAEVIQAHIDRFPKEGKKGRPEQVLEEIIRHTSADFDTVCRAFWERESIYGFGDVQVRAMYDKIKTNPA